MQKTWTYVHCMARLKNFHCFSCKVNVYCRVLSYVAIEITQYPYHIAGYKVENNEYWNIENIDTLLMRPVLAKMCLVLTLHNI